MRKVQRCCSKCGKIFYGDPSLRMCPDCAKESRSQNVIRDRICIDCGASFPGGPRARRCPNCRVVAAKETTKQYRQNGAKRPIGSFDKCQMCGKEYVVESGRQKYCKQCKDEASLLWQREHKAGYHKQPEQIQAKKQRRIERKRVCGYCQRVYWDSVPSNLCSDYCREQQHRIAQCKSDIKRGYNRNMQALIDSREEYRRKVKEQEKTTDIDELI